MRVGSKSTFFSTTSRPQILLTLIGINLLLFVIIRMSALFSGNDAVLLNLALPSSPQTLASKPWTVLTYMFTQFGVLHVIFNMLALFWFGNLLSIRFSQKRLLTLYVSAGITGAIFYLLGAWIFPAVGGDLLGSSAAVMGIMVAAAVIMPDYEVGLLLLGNIKLKWIAIGCLVIFALGLTGANAGGHIAHIGGMGAGLVYALIYVNNEKKSYRIRKIKREKPTDLQQLDSLLDKMKRSGYSSLTKEEKERLTLIGSRLRQSERKRNEP